MENPVYRNGDCQTLCQNVLRPRKNVRVPPNKSCKLQQKCSHAPQEVSDETQNVHQIAHEPNKPRFWRHDLLQASRPSIPRTHSCPFVQLPTKSSFHAETPGQWQTMSALELQVTVCDSYYFFQWATHKSQARSQIWSYDVIMIPVLPARGGAEVALGLCYKAFFVCRFCARRAPPRPVHVCFVRKWCTVVAQENEPHTTTLQCNAKQHFAVQR